MVIPELNPRLCRGEWQKLCCSICDKKAPSVWWLAEHFGGRSDTEGATGEIILFEKYSTLKTNFKGHSFWARGYYVSTVGLDEARVRKYIQDQEMNESVEDQYNSDLSNSF